MGLFTIGIVCSVGIGRARGGRARNEDNYLVCTGGKVCWRDGEAEHTEPGDGEGAIVAICDGMGGHRDGEVASTTAVRVLAKLYRPGVPSDGSRAMRRYVLESHRRLHWRARESGPVTMGTTLTSVWLLNGQAAWVQVGDSRLYLFREGKLTQITADHTRNEFARRDGRANPPDGHHLAQNFIFGSRGLGDDSSLRMEAGLDSGAIELVAGDRLLLCTDGLCGVVDDASIGEVLRNTPEPQAAAIACLDRAIARGSTDNITVLVVRVDQPPPRAVADGHWDDDDDDSTGFFE
jgi:serine/threonine protein phosphatase PrpC